MIYFVWVPLLVPFLAGPVGRRLLSYLAPRRAVWVLTVTAAGLAISSTAALALLVVPGATRVHAVAALGDLLTPLATGSPDAVVAVATVASALLLWCAALLVRRLTRRAAQLRQARRLAAGADGELIVLRDDSPDAYALPGRPGRIVATTGMLRALSPAEREALFAHERAHLTDRHHLFLAVTELAGLCHPGLRALREPLSYALERSADEAAAQSVGDRHLAARAIGKAALATRAAQSPGAGRPGFALAATAGPVPRRVAALLDREARGTPARRTMSRVLATGLLLCLALSAGSALEAAGDLHASIEVAQGESPRD
ncbi:M56 family metallopeptidase [Streptomyces sp. AK02-01A]|uniref:M56 family metallopeptidase n=1 Tax=Streptomyces sp. AK02-01A TaxID=3028648 RepID=UPI0029B73F96|nr:M56 family metallopeptidase [Streptomyces sp. AK02-01A]MDX3852761.1 M56 family metallopeptidase [Streptomyces sp. AK02-01A]